MKKTRKIIRTILLVLVSAAFLMAAYGKFTHNPQDVGLFNALGIPEFMIGAGIINLLIVVTLWWRPTRNIGTLIGTGYLGGAILATLMLAPQGLWMPGIILLMIWGIAKLSHGGCHYCKVDGHCHCSCARCTDCNSQTLEKPEMCNCKPGCECVKGACSC